MTRFEHLTGLIPAMFTPMNRQGDLATDRIEPLCEALVRGGVRGVLVCGTTGECLSLTTEERMRLAQRWTDVAGGELAVLVHVGHNCLPAAKALTSHAHKIRAHAVAAFAPSYFRPKSPEDLTAFCTEIASAAPELPFYYYHIPSMTGVNIPVYDFFQVAGRRIPNLAGTKYTHNDLMDFGRALRMEGGRFDMLFGRDEFLLSALALGARGAVGTTYSFAAPLYVDILKAWDAGDPDTAGELQNRAMELVSVFRRFGDLPAGKAMMEMIGLDCGAVRLPLRNLSRQERSGLRTSLDEIGFFEYCVRA